MLTVFIIFFLFFLAFIVSAELDNREFLAAVALATLLALCVTALVAIFA